MLAALKISDPEAYEREMNPKPGHKGLQGLKSDSRRGSLLLPESRSRQGSIQLGGAERRGSYYHDEVTTRASVAMVTDDPEHKKKLKSDLAGAFADNGDLRDILGDLPADASDEEIAARLKAAGLSDSDAKMMMKATKGKGLSPEARALMEQILASTASQDEISSRVSALLAGTALSTTRGVDKVAGREIDMAGYETANLSEARERKDGFEMPDIPNVVIPELREGAVNGVTMRDHSGGAGSVKRQSEIMREKKKSRQEERDEERERKASYFRT